jgi:cardiolipin synthase
VVIGREFGQQMQAMFNKDLAASDAILLEQWENRSLILKIKEWFSGFIQYWL